MQVDVDQNQKRGLRKRRHGGAVSLRRTNFDRERDLDSTVARFNPHAVRSLRSLISIYASGARNQRKFQPFSCSRPSRAYQIPY